MTNVALPRNTFVDLYAATGIVVGIQIEALNLTGSDVNLYATAATPTAADDHIPLPYRSGTAQNDAGDPGAWALSVSGGGIDVKPA